MKSSTRKRNKLILTCEHGGYRLPAPWNSRLNIPLKVLQSHRGWDLGALRLVKYFHAALPSRLVTQEITRLLVDCNRSRDHRDLLSDFSRGLSKTDREQVVKKYYQPYWDTIGRQIKAWHQKGHRVLHLSIHSFTPRLRGKTRQADLGFLYDPSRKLERAGVALLSGQLKAELPQYRFRKNYPYRGTSDGLIPALRKIFSDKKYFGLELEFNQALISSWNSGSKKLAGSLVEKLRLVLPRL